LNCDIQKLFLNRKWLWDCIIQKYFFIIKKQNEYWHIRKLCCEKEIPLCETLENKVWIHMKFRSEKLCYYKMKISLF